MKYISVFYYNLFILIFYILSFSNIFSQTKIEETKEDKTDIINETINKIKSNKFMTHASWGVCVINTKTGSTVAEYNSNISMIPASVMKAITTSTAISKLGGNYRFTTRIEYKGKIDSNGILHGDLYIIGGCDPTLGSDRYGQSYSLDSTLNRWCDSLKAKGIKAINGNIYADESYSDDSYVPSEWIWGDMGNYYGAGSGAINVCENGYAVQFKVGKNTGDSTEVIKTIPKLYTEKLINRVKTGKKFSGDCVEIFGAPFSPIRILKGTVPLGDSIFEVYGSMADPALFLCISLDSALKKKDIVHKGFNKTLREMKINEEYIDTTGRKNLFVNYSPRLYTIVLQTNLRSINLAAECLLKAIGYQYGGIATTNNGIISVYKFWKNKGLDLSGFRMRDGSGLSHYNCITPFILASMLKAYTKDSGYSTFYNSLPIAGRSGTLSGILKKSVAENNLRAKSGYMQNIRTYAGYVKNANGDLLSFAIMSNNYDSTPSEMRILLEELMISITKSK